MRCTRCGHRREAHALGAEHKCSTRIAYDWDEQKKTFQRFAPCLCPGYRGEECPHEYVKTQSQCVHCGHVKVAAKGKK
jgi:hypothetical protein